MSSKTSRDKGYGVGVTASGDKYFVNFEGTTTYEKDVPVSGTCTGKFDATGAAVFGIEGEYQVGAAKAKYRLRRHPNA